MHYHFYASEKEKKMIDYIIVLQEKNYIVITLSMLIMN